ncbi:MAG: AAA family ATPase [Cyanobacteria bacterium P01_G01_bin.39]
MDELCHSVEKNRLKADRWAEHAESYTFELEKNQLLEIFNQIRHKLHKLAQAKQQNMFEAISFGIEKKEIEDLWNDFISMVDACNNSISKSITNIADFKENLAGEDIQCIEKEIENARLVKLRQDQNVCGLIQQWNNAKKEKKLCQQNKKQARSELDNLMTNTLRQYQTKINILVSKFGALFEIQELSHKYQGSGMPRSSYGLKVKGIDVKLSANDAPSFSTALSEGDKRTLAFAFFIARLEADRNLSNKIIVVDDPVCSLDSTRRNHTKRILRDIGMKSAQLIVLGHDQYFLRDLRDAFQKSPVNISPQIFKINRVANNYSDFSTCDIDSECASGYYKNYQILNSFIDGASINDLSTIARAIRPLLEGYLHRRFPSHIQRDKLFGQIIGDVNTAISPNPLIYIKPLVSELHEINDYAGKFHHDASASSNTTEIDETELQSYVKRALDVIHKGEP